MLRRRLAEARDEYAARAREGRGGLDVLARYADRMDGLVREIAESAGAQTTMPIAVCALGGYGRRMLCLHSDIDLLIVTEGPIGSREELAISSLLQPLWDLRLTVGQHVREFADFTRVEPDNAELLLALLDIRFLAGHRGLYDRLEAAPGDDSVRTRPSRRTRPPRAAGGSARTVQSDDLPARTGREGRAGRTSRHRSAPGSSGPCAPTSSSIGQLAESERLRDAEELLFRASLAAARRDRAQLERADSRTPGNGRGGDGLRRRGAAAAGRAPDVRLLPPGPSRGSRPLGFARGAGAGAPRRGAPSRIGRHLEIAADGVRFVDPARVASMPTMWVEAFRVALANDCGVSEQARTCIEQNVDAFTADDFVGTEGDRQQLRSAVRAAAGPVRIVCPRCTTAGCWPAFSRSSP